MRIPKTSSLLRKTGIHAFTALRDRPDRLAQWVAQVHEGSKGPTDNPDTTARTVTPDTLVKWALADHKASRDPKESREKKEPMGGSLLDGPARKDREDHKATADHKELLDLTEKSVRRDREDLRAARDLLVDPVLMGDPDPKEKSVDLDKTPSTVPARNEALGLTQVAHMAAQLAAAMATTRRAVPTLPAALITNVAVIIKRNYKP